MALLEIRNLSFVYADGFHVGLERLALDEGGTTAIVGVSGSGKSTLLECIGLLNLQFRADIFALGGQAIDLHAPRAQLDELRVRSIGYMPQNSALLPFLTIRDNILCQIRLVLGKQLSRGEDLDYLDHLHQYFVHLKIERLLGKLPHEISVGQRQRASFIKALAARPRLLLIDEPTSSLDHKHAALMFECIRDIAQAENIAALVVTHDIHGVRDFAICAYDESTSIFRPRLAGDGKAGGAENAHLAAMSQTEGRDSDPAPPPPSAADPQAAGVPAAAAEQNTPPVTPAPAGNPEPLSALPSSAPASLPAAASTELPAAGPPLLPGASRTASAAQPLSTKAAGRPRSLKATAAGALRGRTPAPVRPSAPPPSAADPQAAATPGAQQDQEGLEGREILPREQAPAARPQQPDA